MDINKYFKINKENLLNLLDNLIGGEDASSVTIDKDMMDDKIDEDVYILDGFSVKNEIYVLGYILDNDKIILLKGYQSDDTNRCKVINDIDSDLFIAIIKDIYEDLDLDIVTINNELLDTDEYLKYKLKNRM